MNIHSKNGVRTIKLDKAERRTISRFVELMGELSIYASHLEMIQSDIGESVTQRIDGDGVFSPEETK